MSENVETLEKLYTEKKLNPKKIQAVEKKPKKIKKKDIIIEDISTRELQYYEFEVINGIKIYNGVLIDKKKEVLNNIEFYKNISKHDIFTELYPSTLTSRGNLTNILFTEEEFIKTLDIPSIKFAEILSIGCNYGEIYIYPNAFINHDISTMIKSVLVLNGENIKIGCSCNKDLIDIDSIYSLIKIINLSVEKFDILYKKNIKEKLPLDKKYNKKKITKIFKNFQAIQNFQILESDEIKELYTTIETYITPSEIDFCNIYLDNIIQMIKIFTSYSNLCKCAQKFSDDNNLNLDKNKLVKAIKSSTRGRKPKEKKKTKRKIQGSGTYFSSQISFDIYNHHNKKITKIKLFRNGNIQIPGIKQPNMSDLIDSVTLLKDYLNYLNEKNNILDKPIEIPYVISVMRNYTCRIQNLNITIILNKLEDILYFEKGMPLNKVPFEKYLKFLKTLNTMDSTRHEVFKYFNIAFDSISEISLNSERYPGLLVKFNRPIPDKDNKKLTVKILSSGKLNFDGSSSALEVFEIYYWLQYIFIKYWSEITYDDSKKLEEVVSDDSNEGYLSIYDA